MKSIVCILLLCLSAFAASSNQTANQSVTVTVKAVTGLTITPPASVPNIVIVNGVVQPYPGATFSVSGGTAPYVWSITSGTLPAGLSFTTGGTSGSSGILGGTPAASAATSTFTIQVTDSSSTVAQIDLKWQASPSPTVATYKVYRGAAKGGPYPTVVGQVAAATTALVDSLTGVASGRTFAYVATALDTAGKESIFSNEAFVTLP